MDMNSRSQYLQTLIQKHGYHTSRKKQKTALLDEYCRNTGQNRKYAIRKLSRSQKSTGPKKKRRTKYQPVEPVLGKLWEIFNYPCGQRLKPLIDHELDRLIGFGEIRLPPELIFLAKQISPATIDRLLRERKLKTLLSGRPRNHPKTSGVYQKVAVKTYREWNLHELGNLQLDFVEHNGGDSRGDYLNSFSLTDVGSSWWEGQALLGKSKRFTHQALEKISQRLPFPIRELHPDNDSRLVNYSIYYWSLNRGIKLSRSRPNHKNDNAYVEQKNWSCVRKMFGYARYDTEKEQEVMNSLYENELRLYYNFFQPVSRVARKERLGAKLKRVYHTPKTPYQMLLESGQLSEEKKAELEQLYESLNPARLKRMIEVKLTQLRLIRKNK